MDLRGLVVGHRSILTTSALCWEYGLEERGEDYADQRVKDEGKDVMATRDSLLATHPSSGIDICF